MLQGMMVRNGRLNLHEQMQKRARLVLVSVEEEGIASDRSL
jgi:hypothetical protein